ncbi:hypothetical protein EVAR_59487_1 [Eumeta japonica]|uniref:Uncharacterized protein n=1 Tax=Eumeta variegata TaxID=151549 RepID=A0A4C1YIB5_EUMVA|nr:hypothetical protein EVAR_59487_1 [Eumeta japonica]
MQHPTHRLPSNLFFHCVYSFDETKTEVIDRTKRGWEFNLVYDLTHVRHDVHSWRTRLTETTIKNEAAASAAAHRRGRLVQPIAELIRALIATRSRQTSSSRWTKSFQTSNIRKG